MIASAAKFLDHLELIKAGGRQLPDLCTMIRINSLLTEMLGGEICDETRTRDFPETNVTPNPPLVEEESVIVHSETNAVTGRIDSRIEVLGDHIYNNWTGKNDHEIDIEIFRAALDSMATRNTPIFLDIQYLNSYSDYVVKEFSAQCFGSDIAWIMVKSPSGTRQREDENNFVTEHVNGISWNAGAIDENQLREMTSKLFASDRPVYVKGREKAEIILRKLDINESSVTALDYYPKLNALRRSYFSIPCPHHFDLDGNFSCAMVHAKILFWHYQKHEECCSAKIF